MSNQEQTASQCSECGHSDSIRGCDCHGSSYNLNPCLCQRPRTYQSDALGTVAIPED